MNATSVIAMITDLVAEVGTVLVGGLGVILGLVAVLIGLFFILRLISRKIGGAK